MNLYVNKKIPELFI